MGFIVSGPFFKDLVEFMISGPVMVQALEGEGAILKIVTSWARLIPRRRRQEQSGPTLPTVLMPTRSMALMGLTPPARRLRFSSRQWRFTVDKLNTW